MTKICVICDRKIIDTKERWVRLTDFHKKRQTGEVFYHLECWRDRFNISNSLRKQKMYEQIAKPLGSIFQAMKRMNSSEDKDSRQVYEIGIKR